MILFYSIVLSLFVHSFSFANADLTLRLEEDLGTLDWNYGEINEEIVYQIMEGLFQGDENGSPKPAAVGSYTWNDDHTQLNINLKKDRRWSDDMPLCASHFVESWKRLRSKEFASPYAHFANAIKDMFPRSCRELIVRFERSTPEGLAILSHYVFLPIRQDLIAKDKKYFQSGKDLVVNGPYKVKEWDLNKKVLLEKNLSYPRKNYKFNSVEFVFVPEESTAKTMFDQGRIDWMKGLSPLSRSAKLEKSPTFKTFPSFTSYYFGLNQEYSDLLKDKNIRHALSDALDRKQIQKILGKESRGTSTWLAKEMLSSIKNQRQKANLEEAKKILKEAAKKEKMDLKLRTYAKPAHKLLAEWAQGQWEKNLGIRIPIEVVEEKVYWKEIYAKPGAIFFGGVTAPYGHPRAYYQEFFKNSSANWTGWTSASYDEAVYKENFQTAEDILLSDGYIIPLYSKDIVVLVSKKWKSFFINPLGQFFIEGMN
ncbi:MAG: peptide ABC transporter substrate-binding protein [Oligoflexia bacterium]|nr:peptide ABC transporter substrate-binding protein [Oligoflexia bacterium]